MPTHRRRHCATAHPAAAGTAVDYSAARACAAPRPQRRDAARSCGPGASGAGSGCRALSFSISVHARTLAASRSVDIRPCCIVSPARDSATPPGAKPRWDPLHFRLRLLPGLLWVCSPPPAQRCRFFKRGLCNRLALEAAPRELSESCRLFSMFPPPLTTGTGLETAGRTCSQGNERSTA